MSVDHVYWIVSEPAGDHLVLKCSPRPALTWDEFTDWESAKDPVRRKIAAVDDVPRESVVLRFVDRAAFVEA